jgi:hypothetical protein
MPNANAEVAGIEKVRAELAGKEEVERAFVDAEGGGLYLICAAGCDAEEVELAARALLAGAGLSEIPLSVTSSAPPQPRRRVRFVRAEVEETQRDAGASVTLEWGGEVITRSTRGERGGVADLRLAALATLTCLDAILDGRLSLDLVGVKAIRAFDVDLIAVLIRAEGSPAPLVGSVLAGERERADAAALAVLTAVNRLLGNYLHTND